MTRAQCPLALGLLAAWLGACTHTRPWIREGYQNGPAPLPVQSIDHRLILIGDTGGPVEDVRPVLETAARRARETPGRTTIVLLGDNVYPDGVAALGHPDRAEAVRRLGGQVAALAAEGARLVFVPGNHDWDDSGREGWDRVRNQEKVLADLALQVAGTSVGESDTVQIPTQGCPGPHLLDLGAHLRLVAIDTQWPLHDEDKPSPAENPEQCPAVTEGAWEAELRSQVASARPRNVVVAAHHPLETRGPHDGFYDWKIHLFALRALESQLDGWRRPLQWIPLPVFGSLVAAGRSLLSPSRQDTSNPTNRSMRDRIERAFVPDPEAPGPDFPPPLLYAAGHDHSLQVFAGGSSSARYRAVSGHSFLGHATEVGHNRHSLFAYANDDHPGFMIVDIDRTGAVRLAVIEYDAGHPRGVSVFSIELKPGGEP